MKKQYTKLKIKLVTLIILVLVIGCSVLTYQKANEISADCQSQMDYGFVQDMRWNLDFSEGENDIIKHAYRCFDDASRVTDVGFYSMLKDSSGNTVAEDQYYMIVEKSGEDNDRRIILLGDNFFSDDMYFQTRFGNGNRFKITDSEGVVTEYEHHSFSRIEIIGTCDDIYVYPEKIIWESFSGDVYTYIPQEDFTDKGTMKFEEWAGSNVYEETLWENNSYIVFHNSVSYTYGDWEKSEKLNAKAKEICEQIYEDFVNDIDTYDDQSKDGLFTCYIAGTGYLGDGYAMPFVYVFHPVSMAMEELLGVYLGAAILGLIIIAIVCSLVNKIHKQQLAYEMNRRELTRGIAHELKTPIAIVKGYVENWKYMDEENKEESSQTMIDEMNHMNIMVTDLLELSRLEAKAKEMHPESVDIHSLAKSVLGRMKEMINEKSLQVSITPENGEFLANADLEMMRTVLVNFITNAVKYADKTIDINLLVIGNKIKFSIANDGKKLEEQKLKKVWDEFYRDGYSNDHNMGSSGLGLAITKNILILHDAKYGCDSKDGRTVFWFEMKKSVE